ncbi:MAG: hypothetical protein ACI95R_002205, partial [Halioglobus sp.]
SDGRAGGQRQRVQFTAHAALEGGVDGALLLDAVHAAKFFGLNRGGVMISVASEILDLNSRGGKRLFDETLDLRRFHGHGSSFRDRPLIAM